MPDLDRTTLLKAIDICRSMREQLAIHPTHSGAASGAHECVRELSALLLASSEAPAEAFTLGQAFVSRVTGADNQPDLSVMGAGDGLPMMFTPEQILDEAEMHAMDGEAGAMCAAMLTDYARLVRERHTGKG